jgi:hypothetical protein
MLGFTLRLSAFARFFLPSSGQEVQGSDTTDAGQR